MCALSIRYISKVLLTRKGAKYLKSCCGCGNICAIIHTKTIRYCSVDTQLKDNNDPERNRYLIIKSTLEDIFKNKPISTTKPKSIVIDFSSPNIAKPFHAGHLRSTIIGNFISNINKYYNHNVTKINYLGDWGTQFGLLKYGMKKKKVSIKTLKSDPINILFECYVYANKLSKNDPSVLEEARKYFSDIEEGKINLDDWRLIREYTVDELETIYNRLGVTFNFYDWESDYNANVIKDIINMLEVKKVVHTDSKGKKVVKYNDTEVSLVKSDGSSLYLSRDIAALLDRKKRFNLDEMIYVVDKSQKNHFAALFDIASKLDVNFQNKCKHVSFGRVTGMSTRNGQVVFLKNILDEAKSKMHQKQLMSRNTRRTAMNDKTCDILGTTAVIVNDLKHNRLKDYAFDWDKALQSEGDSGIKLQYLHCKLCSLELKSGVTPASECNPDYLREPIALEIATELAKFHEVLELSYKDYQANLLVHYLFKLCRTTNNGFKVLNVKYVPEPVASQRLLLFNACRSVVRQGLELLGVRPLSEM